MFLKVDVRGIKVTACGVLQSSPVLSEGGWIGSYPQQALTCCNIEKSTKDTRLLPSLPMSFLVLVA